MVICKYDRIYISGVRHVDASMTSQQKVKLMSFADPSVIPYSGGSVNADRIKEQDNASVYRVSNSTSRTVLQIRHTVVSAKGSEPAKDRHNVELVRTTFASGAVAEYSEKVYFVMENIQSSTSVEMGNALANWLIASTNANLTKLVGWHV